VIEKLTPLQQHRNPSPKHRKPKTFPQQKKLQNKNYVLEFEITKSDLRSHKMGLYPLKNILNLVHI
jgi:hypothetical protein